MTHDDGQSECPFEAPVLSALATASLAGDLLSHAQACSTCRETILAWSYFNTVAAAQPEVPLPSPHLIWWKAQLAQQRQLAERSLTVINLFQKLALALAVLALSLCAFCVAPHLPGPVPSAYLWGALCLVGLSLLTAASFFYSDRHTSRR